jgi:hypothetical protein
MVSAPNRFQILADRVGRGDSRAASELRRRLEGSLGPVVRRALRGGGGSAVAERIQALARRAAPPGAPPAEDDVVDHVAGSLCARVVGRLRAGADSVSLRCDTLAV